MFKAPDAEPFALTKVQFWLMYSGEGCQMAVAEGATGAGRERRQPA